MNYYSKSVEGVLREFDSSAAGLSNIEVSKRRRQYGANRVVVKKRPLWRRVVQPFASVFMIILVIAAAISFWHDAPVDGAIILAVIVLSALIDYIQQFSTERIIRSLQKKTPHIVSVIRDNTTITCQASELVPGDIVLLTEGDKVPADARLIACTSLRVDESQLTGESEPVTKTPAKLSGRQELYEQSNMVFQGSFVTGGSGRAVVIATGRSTEFGRMATLATDTSEESPVGKRIDALITKVIFAVSLLALITFGLAVMRGMEAFEALKFVIAVAVSAVPEGLPVAISVILAVGMYRMAKRRALVRSMAAIESIGVITTIATDKTGTLTKNQLTVLELWSPERSLKQLKRTLTHVSLPKSADHLGRDPLDTALDDYARRYRFIQPRHLPAQTFSFEHTTAISGTLYHDGEDYTLYVKGSPETILDRAALTENDRERAVACIHHYAGLGYRVIALAHATKVPKVASLRRLPATAKLQFDGLIAVADALRPEARSAIKQALRAGISVRMITGDHYETAYHIGRKLGLCASRSEVFDAREMRYMGDEELADVLPHIRVFARVTPERKHRILTILKENDIAAMTGDGINDVPALTNAHVGIAMGSGSDIAKDAGDIILLNNDFGSIVDAVHEGRTIFANIQRMVAYLLSTNLAEAAISIIALAMGYPIPLLPIQILWINLVTDTTMVIPLGLEPPRDNTMKRPPIRPGAPLLSATLLSRMIILTIVITWFIIGVYITYMTRYGVDYARTTVFCALVAIQWSSALCFRSGHDPFWKRMFTRNPSFWFGIVLSVILQIVAVLGPLAPLLHLTNISYGDIAYVGFLALLLPIITIELHKYIVRRYFKK